MPEDKPQSSENVTPRPSVEEIEEQRRIAERNAKILRDKELEENVRNFYRLDASKLRPEQKNQVQAIMNEIRERFDTIILEKNISLRSTNSDKSFQPIHDPEGPIGIRKGIEDLAEFQGAVKAVIGGISIDAQREMYDLFAPEIEQGYKKINAVINQSQITPKPAESPTRESHETEKKTTPVEPYHKPKQDEHAKAGDSEKSKPWIERANNWFKERRKNSRVLKAIKWPFVTLEREADALWKILSESWLGKWIDSFSGISRPKHQNFLFGIGKKSSSRHDSHH